MLCSLAWPPPSNTSCAVCVSDGSTGETLIGASVVIKGTTTGATTDIDGRFEILTNELPPYTLVVSFIGYTPAGDPGEELGPGI